jgi:hypothetical protein
MPTKEHARLEDARTGTAAWTNGGHISANARGTRCERTTARTATPGTSSPTITPAPAPIAGRRRHRQRSKRHAAVSRCEVTRTSGVYTARSGRVLRHWHRHGDVQSGSPVRARPDVEVTAHRFDALAHVNQSEALVLHSLYDESHAVVHNGQLETIAIAGQVYGIVLA